MSRMKRSGLVLHEHFKGAKDVETISRDVVLSDRMPAAAVNHRLSVIIDQRRQGRLCVES